MSNKKSADVSGIILFVAQITLSFILVIISLWHLSDHKCEDRALWYSMFTGAIAYLIPNPSITPLSFMKKEEVEEDEKMSEESDSAL